MLTPSPELDRSVAEACGFSFDVNAHGMIFRNGEDESDWFEPSTDLNDAFLAAGRIASTISLLYDDAISAWHAALDGRRSTADDCRFRATEDTPALAICAAILAMKGKA